MWLGWPPSHGSFTSPNQIPTQDRHRFLLFLEAHSLSIKDFVSVIRGEKVGNKHIFQNSSCLNYIKYQCGNDDLLPRCRERLFRSGRTR